MPPISSYRARGITRQAPETKPGSGIAVAPVVGGCRLPRPARPRDAGEVDDPAAGVDRPPALGGDQRLPCRPPASLRQRPLDRVAPARLGNGVGVEQAEQLARSPPRRRGCRRPRSRDSRPSRSAPRPGRSSRTASGVPSADALSTTISSSPSRSCATSAGSVAPTASRESWVTMTTERVGAGSSHLRAYSRERRPERQPPFISTATSFISMAPMERAGSEPG